MTPCISLEGFGVNYSSCIKRNSDVHSLKERVVDGIRCAQTLCRILLKELKMNINGKSRGVILPALTIQMKRRSSYLMGRKVGKQIRLCTVSLGSE